MGYKVITPPVEPVTLAEARLHLRVTDTGEDSLIGALITSAREYCQHYTQRAIGSQTLELALDAFPGGAIELPMSPASSITSIKYIDTDGAEQTIAAPVYLLDDYSHVSWVTRVTRTTWPATQNAANAVKVRYVVGSMTGTTRAAMLLMIGHLFENRASVDHSRDTFQEIPMGVKALLDTDRSWAL